MEVRLRIISNYCNIGNEVAEYARDHFVQELIKLPSFKSKDYVKALKEIFMLIDDLLETKEGREKLKTYVKSGKAREGMESIGYHAGATACVALLIDN